MEDSNLNPCRKFDCILSTDIETCRLHHVVSSPFFSLRNDCSWLVHNDQVLSAFVHCCALNQVERHNPSHVVTTFYHYPFRPTQSAYSDPFICFSISILSNWPLHFHSTVGWILFSLSYPIFRVAFRKEKDCIVKEKIFCLILNEECVCTKKSFAKFCTNLIHFVTKFSLKVRNESKQPALDKHFLRLINILLTK